MQRENNFDLLRLVLAWMVVVVHCADLSVQPQLQGILPWISSRVAVEGFFAISGCLIVASWDRSSKVSGYFRRRAQRILPGYWLAFVYTMALGAVVTTFPLGEFVRAGSTWKYVAANLTFANFLQPDLPGVFLHNDISAMNGALWTIKVEVMFYLFVPVMVWLCRKFGWQWALGSLFVLSSIYRMVLDGQGRHSLAWQLPGQLAYFCTGAAVYYGYGWFARNKGWMWPVAIFASGVGCWFNFFPLRAVGIPLLVMCIGFLAPVVRGVTKYGDFSYGTYVLHFPTVQLFVSLGLFARSPWLALVGMCGTVAVLAVISWYAVERHFLRVARVRQQEHEVVEAVA